MQRMMRFLLYKGRYLLICIGLSYCFPSFAVGLTSSEPVFCYRGECLYCNEDDCLLAPLNANQLAKHDNAKPKVHTQQTTTTLKRMKYSPQHKRQAPKKASSKHTRKSSTSTPIVADFIKPLQMFHYQPTIAVAQYALHQGDARSANLIEGFIPLGKFTFSHVLFL